MYDCFGQVQHDKNTDEKLAKFKVAVKEAIDVIPKHKNTDNETGGGTINITLSDDELDVNDTDVMIVKNSIEVQDFPDNAMGSVYPNLQQLNLMGEDFNQLIPSKTLERQRKDDTNGISLNNLKL